MRQIAPALGLLFLLSACGGGSSTTSADAASSDSSTSLTAGQNAGGAPRGGPPQAAIDACSGMTDGATCSVVTPMGDTVAGSCATAPTGDVACRPDQAPGGNGGPNGGPPQAAIYACSGMTDGATCSVTTPMGDTVAGSCATTPAGDVACRPDRAPAQP